MPTRKQLPAKPLDETIPEIVKKKRKRPDLTEMFSPHCEPGEISKMLGQAITISHWPPINTDDAQQVSERIDKYHLFCIQNDIKPDMVGMALAIGVDRTTLWRWETGDVKKGKDVCNIIKKGREINELMMVQMMQNGKINPVAAIFLLKNSHGYRDQQDVVVTPNNPYDNVSQEELAQKYLQGAVKTENE